MQDESVSRLAHTLRIQGRASETEAHINEALRLAPRDITAFIWLQLVGSARRSSQRTLKQSADSSAASKPTEIAAASAKNAERLPR
jgi:hypothetical protein